MHPSWLGEHTKRLDARRTARVVLAAVVLSRVPADAVLGGLFAAPCASASPRVVRLLVVNGADVAPEALEAAAEEAGAIWGKAGVRLEWTFAPTSLARSDGDTVIVAIRRALRMPPAEGETAPSPSHALGRVSFGTDGQPAPLIEVSIDAISRLVMAGSQFDRPIRVLPSASQRTLVGRGLGRVVAHELGHWLAGRAHAASGVMKAGYQARDLVESITPLLPPGWRALLGGKPRDPQCEPPGVR